ncbi:DUF2752 domain-containing protein [Streptomyces sp. B6B3]|uniref:DUF2752 domain-containing protein n=1 Tax=Streptomyces sp. B6B3 TaxID=3153570 RepID=UPI00325F5FDB
MVALGAGAAALGYVGAVDPNRPGRYPACPVAALTGLSCPGCGGLRSAHALAHGDLAAALGANALAVAVLAALTVALLTWLLRAARGRPGAPPRPRRWSTVGRPTGRAAVLAASLLVAAFTLVRNLPPGAALAP